MDKTEARKLLEEHTIQEENAREFFPHPGVTGNKFEDGKTVYGHATLDTDIVATVKLFGKQANARQDFEQNPHPAGASVFFTGVIRNLTNGNAVVDDVTILEIEMPSQSKI